MANKEKQAENKEKIGIGAWLALCIMVFNAVFPFSKKA